MAEGGEKVTPILDDGSANGFAFTNEAKGGKKVTLVDDTGTPIVIGSGGVTNVTTTFNPINNILTTEVDGLSDTADFTGLTDTVYKDIDVSPMLPLDENWQTIGIFAPDGLGIIQLKSGSLMGDLTFSRTGGGGAGSYINVRFENDGVFSRVKSQLIDRDESQTIFFTNIKRVLTLNSNVDLKLQVKYTSEPDGLTAGAGTGTLERVISSVTGFSK